MTFDREAAATREHELFAHFSLDALVSATARLRSDSVAFHDRTQSLPYGLLAAQVAAFARQLQEGGLKPGERIVIAGGAEIGLIIALVAALRGGYEPALAPLDLSPEDLCAYACTIGAAALIGPSHYGDLSVVETFLATAASVPTIRLVASYGPESFDGAVDLSPAACLTYAASHPDSGLERARSAADGAPGIITLDRRDGLKPVRHAQSTLIAAALDFAARAKIGRETPILCTLPPISFAGLVAGPCAALLSGAALHLHGPFDAEDFLKTRDRLAQPHLVLPLAVAGDFLRAEVMTDLASAVLVSRPTTQMLQHVPKPMEAPCALVDLYAIAEMAAIAEPRQNGTAQPPAQEPHFIGFDEARVLAIAAVPAGANRLALQGAAVTTEH